MRLELVLATAVIFVLAGMQFDRRYQSSIPEAVYVQGTVIGFERPRRRPVYPIFEFTDQNGQVHHVVNSSQQAIVRFAIGDAVPVAYSRLDPQRARIDTFWFDHRWVLAALIVALTLVIGALTRRESGSDR
jgi:hypothetical protein